jgi:hypothetical protein
VDKHADRPKWQSLWWWPVSQVNTYLQLGQDLDPAPGLPADIANLTGLNANPAVISNRGGVSPGSGFIFGADIQIGQKEYPPFLNIFYAGFRVRLGFDLALLDYGNNAICAGSGDQIGIDGWYASGQLYAGIWGHVDMKVKLFGKWKKFKIFELEAAAAMQASMPNPFYAIGAIGGKYDILNGLVKGDFQEDFPIGEQCVIQGANAPIVDITLVNKIVPEDKVTGLASNVKPEVYFNFEMDKEFNLSDPNGNNVNYKAVFEDAKLTWNNFPIPAQLEWSTDHRKLVINPDWMLPEYDSITITVNSHIDSLGVTIYEETKIVGFRTGFGFPNIPESNVKGSYPYNGQYNFFPDQIADRRGYILLERGQPSLFWEAPEELVVEFKTKCGDPIIVPLNYDGFAEKIDFDLPQGAFTPGGIYRMKVLRKGNGAAVGSNNGPIVGGSSSANKPGGSGGPNPALYESGGSCDDTTRIGDRVLYTAYFRVSQYATFGAKMAAWNAARTMQNYTPGSKILVSKASIEPFEAKELGGAGVPGQIEARANLSATPWYTVVKTNFCANCGVGLNPQVIIPATDTSNIDKEVVFRPSSAGNSAPPKVTQTHWQSGSMPNNTVEYVLEYKVPLKASENFHNLRGKTIGYVQQVMTANMGNNSCGLICESSCSLIPAYVKKVYCEDGGFTEPSLGDYPVVMCYRLPGSVGMPISEQVIILKKTGN